MGFAAILIVFCLSNSAIGADVVLAEGSTLEGILSRGKLRVGMEAGYMPFEFIDKMQGLRKRDVRAAGIRKGKQYVNIIGFDVDIAREMARSLGVKLVVVNTLWPSIIPALNLGRYDIIMSGMSVTEERQKRIDFAEPLMTIGQTILLNKKHKGVIKSYKDLNHSKFIVTSKPGTTGEEAVRKLIPDGTYKPFDTEIECAMQVVNGDADAFVYDLPYNHIFMAMHKPDNVLFLNEPFTNEPIAWAIRKNDPDFLKFLNKFLADIKKDGRYDKIYNKWFISTDWFKHAR